LRIFLKSLAAVAVLGAAPALAQGAAAFMAEAEAALARGDRLGAMHLYQSALIQAPATVAPTLALADFHFAGSEWQLARKYYAAVVEMDPANLDALKGLGLSAVALGDAATAQIQHDILVEVCGPACAEAAVLGQALAALPPAPDTAADEPPPT
jgi:tetratricopeptide (TPR) repeat protein